MKNTIPDAIKVETDTQMVDNTGAPLVLDEKETSKITRKGMFCGVFEVLNNWVNRPELKASIDGMSSTFLRINCKLSAQQLNAYILRN